VKYEVLIMPTAEAELEEAYLWLYQRAPDAAIKWVRLVRKSTAAPEFFRGGPFVFFEYQAFG
jgi:hypothetical protein